jgi:uncharacterized protein YcbX
MPAKIASLHSYPVKSCAGLSHDRAIITPAGLEHDRCWVIVDAQGIFMTQRTYPKMALVHPSLNDDSLVLNAPGMPAIAVSRHTADTAENAVPVRIWAADTLGADEGDGVAQWLSDFLGVSCRLLRQHSKAHRVASPDHVDSWITKHSDWADGFPPEHVFAFADGFPFLMTNQASLDELNQQLLDKGAEPITMNRFRPSIVVSGLEAYDEDYLTGMRIGDLTFAFVKACARCPIPNVDPENAHVGKEPGLTLAKYRSFTDGMLFGVNAVVAGPSPAYLRVGDGVEPEFNF